ncbi:3-hydroxyacyl-CoA dehydrogenase family protein [Planomicrobium chinense]|uniref:3-hydroxyacyl-CoA dehydrogenase family protein n=1 Tax=Planococcus chinensis TaxID=272917 RepID=UPI001CC45FF6|nr:3-hydroxyacyl-CoA dehydrogenase family protein [Planococcus chinensis]MBZ5200858.1 3-hydroxyacyl-CoA dehydrogenase family protein [Planococcus chinensis]
MNDFPIQKMAVIGAGQMGHQIAMLGALGGIHTALYDVDKEALAKAQSSLEMLMDQWVVKKKITDMEKTAAFNLLQFTSDLEKAAGDADYVIEAVVEKLDVKREIFRKLDKITPQHTILATNSSTIVNSLLAEVTSRPEKVCNMHFFFPPLVMDCVEVVMSEQTSEETAQISLELCQRINRTGLLLRKEISGFVANRILGALQKEAMHLYEEGVADYKEIDLIVKKALRHPIGPFELMDLSGIDVAYYVMQQQYAETGDPKDKPSSAIEEKVKAGELGRKTGKGFYDYPKKEVKTP